MKTNTQPGAAVPAHTALPWCSEEIKNIFGERQSLRLIGATDNNVGGIFVADLNEGWGHADANAELICRAVNSHDRLVDCLRMMTDLAERYGAGEDCDGNVMEAREMIARLSRPATATPGKFSHFDQ